MINVNEVQGTEGWKAVRAQHDTASEASAMMGKSKHMTRSQLIKQKATGIIPEVTPAQQAIFDKGHAAEAAARPIANRLVGSELYPVTGISERHHNLLASFDGISMFEDVIWEHKLINADLRLATAETLDEHYKIQMDQQLLVSGSVKCLFMASNGTEDDCNYFWYESTPERQKAIVDGWKQFHADVADYHPEPEAVVLEPAKQANLPALFVDVVGEVTSTNIATFKDVVLQRIADVKTDLVTDQDFVDAEATVKFFTKAEKDLENAKAQALAKTTSIEQLFNTIDELKESMRTKRLDLNKQVTEQKKQRKAELFNNGVRALDAFVADLNTKLSGAQIKKPLVDFMGAIKGKKNFSSMESAIDDALAAGKIEATNEFNKVANNLKIIREEGKEFPFLFSDLQTLVNRDSEDLLNLVRLRIQDHQKAEAERLEAERARIRAEEQRKAEAEAQAKARAEAQARAEAERKALAEQRKAEEEAKAKAVAERNADVAIMAAEDHRAERVEILQAFCDEEVLEKDSQPIAPIPMYEHSVFVKLSAERYDELLHKEAQLQALHAHGVDNWSGYSDAMQSLNDSAA